MPQLKKNPTNASNEEGDALDSQRISDRPKVARMPVHRNAMYYNMNHKRRGIAIIFTHEYFDVHDLDPRTGTKLDSDNLERVLTSLGFNVTIYHDLIYNTLISRIQAVAEMDHSDNDCLLISVMTHGTQGFLYAKDTYYKADNLWQNFTADRCHSLAGKPKLFFIQACQGDKLDGGITLSQTPETDGYSYNQYKIPEHADFLIAYSTIPGYYSWRSISRGSWFIQALCEELRYCGTESNILTLLTFVCQRVALDFESKKPKNISIHQKKQIPCITSMLTRLLVFEKKN